MLKATQLRASIYRVLDEALATGKPVDVERKGRRLRIEPVQRGSKLERLKRRKIMKADPESFVSPDWSGEWNRDLP